MSEREAATAHKPWRMLIVDDSVDDRIEVRRLLLLGSDRKYQFAEAASGAAAIRAVLDPVAGPPDCVILDYNLPDMDATEVLTAIAASDGHVVCPVVVLTGNADLELSRALLRAGAQDYLGKGWMTHQGLTRAVENAAERWTMTRELRIAEAALRASEQRFRSIFDSTFQYIGLLSPDGKVLETNKTALEAAGVEAKDVFGLPLWETNWWNHDPRVQAQMRQAVARAAAGEFVRFETFHHRADGQRAAIDFSLSPIRDETGEVILLVPEGRDVTARKQAEERLRWRERELQSLADNTPDVLSRFDRALRHLFVSRAIEGITGRATTEFIGKTNRELGMPDKLCDLWDAAILSVFEQRRPTALEYDFDAEGGRRYFTTRLVPEIGSSGEVDSVLCVAHDVTDRKAFEQALAAQDRRKDEFLATLAHELRNPLAPIRNGLQVLRLDETHDHIDDIVEMMDRQVGHMVHLVDDLLDVSRVRTGKITLRRERVDVRDAVESAIEVCRPAVADKQHKLELRLAPEVLLIDGDKTRLVQVVANLLTNAAKYSEPGGCIDVATTREGNHVVVRVSDTGVGIAPEALPTLWDMFTQVRDTLDKAQGGLGIGLSLVKKLVELHHGSVAVESEGLGRGSTFIVRFPLAAAAAETAPRPEPPPAAAPIPSRRVLVVDDNRDAANSLVTLLRLAGHDVVAVYNATSALAAATEIQPEVAFLDIGLPDFNGYELARLLQAEFRRFKTTVVALTGWGTADDKLRSQLAGFHYHFTKPISAEAIAEVFAKLSR